MDNQYIELAVGYAPRVVAAVVILIVARIAAGIGRGAVKRVLQKGNADPNLGRFAGNLVYALLIVVGVVAALGKFGVETTSLVAVLGAATFAIGFALQGSLANFAAGVMILLFRPFKAGDFIDAAGISGTVAQIDLFATILNTPDNVQIIVPNSKIYGDIIKNFSANDTRRVDLVVGIGYGSSIDACYESLMGLIKADQRILPDPEPMIAVSELADSSVNLVVRVWVKRADYWGVKFDLTRSLKEDFDKKGIEIPFPQRVVHMMKEA